ncbi:hypothetical protein DXA05_13245 [Bacteroides sp. AM54-2NS]|nr:hypothetical protein DXA05_13245 [Bacteroides sp. AM54-2NS]
MWRILFFPPFHRRNRPFPFSYFISRLDIRKETCGRLFWLSLKPWGIALKFLFLHHENILFPND